MGTLEAGPRDGSTELGHEACLRAECLEIMAVEIWGSGVRVGLFSLILDSEQEQANSQASPVPGRLRMIARHGTRDPSLDSVFLCDGCLHSES